LKFIEVNNRNNNEIKKICQGALGTKGMHFVPNVIVMGQALLIPAAAVLFLSAKAGFQLLSKYTLIWTAVSDRGNPAEGNVK
jgi:hypothetical protein